jgi:hypothetical protein
MLASARCRAVATLALFCLGLFVSACSTVDVSADWDPQEPFSRLRTWAWAPFRAATSEADARLRSDLLHRRIQSSVETTLADQGYTKVPEGTQPDFYVAYHVGVNQAIDTRTMYDSYAVGPYRGAWAVPQTYVDVYEVGTLLLDVIDTKRNQLVWRGTAKARIQNLTDPVEREKRIDEAVRKVLAQFPPQKPA